MRKPFSLFPILILVAFPVCAEFTIPYPENPKKQEIPVLEPEKEERSRPQISSPKEKDKKDSRLSSRNVFGESEKESPSQKPKKFFSRPANRGASFTQPKFYRGLYINNEIVSNKARQKEWEGLLKEASEYGVNVLVIDLQPKTPPPEEIARVKELGFYPVGRLVNFDGGLKTKYPSPERLNSILGYVRKACLSGFPEIQLDYIRYADVTDIDLALKEKYQNINEIVTRIRTEANQCEKLPYLGADIFGRIPFNRDDQIGQKVENFAQMVDVIYPMLYPSHFYGQPSRIANPYQTVYDGLKNTRKRSLSTTRVVGWIQGFGMSLGPSGKSLKDYIKAQIEASVDSNSDGFVVWNIVGKYGDTFRALEESIQSGKLKVED
ncbi:putative glycoside hydrolase [Leptospira sarikeiensis]|uniref:Glycosyl hydrolase n=1 Tax=Leptospira sarikeiensis TaxID=2484943 RepID=A0A4R9JZE0_9LEPT|nr:putative glycoside hydrolase [Leptospira sarikeiensis]TGL57615.1 glycosyl hydrolase [Leptospira sarikeiensis]